MEEIFWDHRRYSKETFIEVWYSSRNISEVVAGLGYPPRGGSGYSRLVKDTAKYLGLSSEHMTIRSREAFTQKRVPIQQLLVKGSIISSSQLRRKLIAENIFDMECSICKLKEWMGLSIPLDLDHINGDRYDNRLENLRFLCKNCHAQTDTYGSKNRGKYVKDVLPAADLCTVCGKEVKYGIKCKICHHNNRETKIKWPSVEYLIERSNEIGFRALGRELGVSDNAIRKHINRNKSR